MHLHLRLHLHLNLHLRLYLHLHLHLAQVVAKVAGGLDPEQLARHQEGSWCTML